MNNLGGVRVGIAFHNDPLDANPIYTYLTALAGVSVQRVETKRGRADERSKVDVGTAQINGIDTAGILDPTNPGGPYYGPDGGYGNPLDPVRQAIIELQNPVTLDWNPIFQGFVGDWTYDVDPAEAFINWQLDLVDALDILDAAEVVPDSAGNAVPQESTGDCFYTGQPVDDRIFAALADAASTLFGVIWPPSKIHIFSGNVYVQGTAYPARTTLLQVIEDAADAEFPGVGVFFASAAGILTFHGRFARFQVDHYTDHGIQIWKAGDAPAFALDAGTAVIATLGFARGKTNLINAALCYPSGIAQAAIPGQLVASLTSISTYAPRSVSFENLITEGGEADGLNAKQETKEYGQYYVDNFKLPRNRVSQITWKTQTPGGVLPGATAARGPAVWGLIAGGSGRHPIDISDLVYLTATHPGGGGFRDEPLFVESVAYLITAGGGDVSQITVTCDMSPKAYYDIAFHNESGGGAPLLAAQFGASFAGLTATFTDESSPGPSGPITAWAWDFGDGGTSTLENPTHAYAAAGDYSVTLSVTGTGADGTATTTLPVSVVDPAALNASFTFSPSALTVTFTDTSTPGPSGPITAWAWDFGDGATSTSQNPSHTYSTGGPYTVTLTATGTAPDGTSTATQSVTVASSSGSFVAATSWARPAFTVVRDVPFSTRAQLDAAIANMQPGDRIHYVGTGVLTISSSSSNAYKITDKNPAGPVVIDFGCSHNIWDPTKVTSNFVRFAYTGTSTFFSFLVNNCSHLRIYGGDYTGKGVWYAGNTHHCYFWDGYGHDDAGFSTIPKDPFTGTNSTQTHNSYRCEVYNWGLHPEQDTHVLAPGTGLHAFLTTDAGGGWSDNTVAVWGHNSDHCGCTFEMGSTLAKGSGLIERNVIYVKAEHEHLHSTQTCSNAINLWGNKDLSTNVFGWIEGNDLYGTVMKSTGGPNTTGMVVQHGRHSNTNLDPSDGITVPYPSGWGIVYNDCT